MSLTLYSVRMRASVDEVHLSGAERLVDGRLENMVSELIWQALTSYALPDKINISVDVVDPASVTCLSALDIKSVSSSSCKEALAISREILTENGTSTEATEQAFSLLMSGPSPEGNNMRGAVIMDAVTGGRMEPDISRGVRVSRMDYTEGARLLLEMRLKECGIYHRRVIDAVAIATKVADAKESIAELCWSDNPEYTTGYVASKKSGYVRITNIKEKESLRGGRVFFVRHEGLKDIAGYINYLEREPVIIDRIGDVKGVGG